MANLNKQETARRRRFRFAPGSWYNVYMLTIDGSYGEGGGQIVRTSMALAAILSRPVCIKNIRAGRNPPGLAAQHLAAIRAAAFICEARLEGDKLGSTQLTFEPHSPPVPGIYEFDVAGARTGGSAGAASLVLQTVLLPLALAQKSSTITVKGGTHVPWSPSYHYLNEVYLPMLAPLGIQAAAELIAWGWYPAGNGEIHLVVEAGTPEAAARASVPAAFPGPQHDVFIRWGQERGELVRISGVAVASSLPAHIAQRMADRALSLLRQAGLPAAIEPQRVRSVSPGAGIFLLAEYEWSRAGFGAIGKIGKPSETVAEEAVNDLLAFHESGTALDQHLADQLVLPVAVCGVPAMLQTAQLSKHTLTNIWVVEQFLGRVAEVDKAANIINFIPRGEGEVWSDE